MATIAIVEKDGKNRLSGRILVFYGKSRQSVSETASGTVHVP